MRVPSFDVTLIIEFFEASAAACGKEFVANRTPQKMVKKNRLAIISFLNQGEDAQRSCSAGAGEQHTTCAARSIFIAMLSRRQLQAFVRCGLDLQNSSHVFCRPLRKLVLGSS